MEARLCSRLEVIVSKRCYCNRLPAGNGKDNAGDECLYVPPLRRAPRRLLEYLSGAAPPALVMLLPMVFLGPAGCEFGG